MAPVQPVLGLGVGEDVELFGLDALQHALADRLRRHAAANQIAHEMVLRAHRRPAQALGAAALGHMNLRVHSRRRQDGHADGAALQLVVQSFGQGHHRVLGHGIGAREKVRVDLKAADGGGVDDMRRVTGLEHPGHQRTDAVDHAAQVDPDHPVPIAGRNLMQRHAMHGNAGVVAADGDRPVGLLDRSDCLLDRGTVGDIDLHGHGAGADRLDLAHGVLRIGQLDVAHAHPHPAAGQGQRDAATDPRPGAAHIGTHPRFDFHVLLLLWRFVMRSLAQGPSAPCARRCPGPLYSLSAAASSGQRAAPAEFTWPSDHKA